MHLGEEGLTDRNLLELRVRHSDQVYIHKFTRAAESRTGADWEWWLMAHNGHCLGFRIQAKVLDTATDCYRYLHHRHGDRYQVDALIKRALTGTYRTIPLVCLYSHVSRRLLRHVDGRCCSFSNRALYGCSVVSAFCVQQLRSKTAVPDILPFATPWHCLVCCSQFGGDSLPARALTYWRRNVLDRDRRHGMHGGPGLSPRPTLPDGSDLFREYGAIQLLNRPPSHVERLMTTRRPQVEPPDANLNGIIVLREQSEPTLQ